MELRQAIEYRRSGRLAEAEVAVREVVVERPFNADACHLLGMVLLERGRAAEAAELMRRSVALAPRTPLFRVNFAGALGRLGQFQEGLSELTEALVLGGGKMPELHNHLGATLEGLGRLRESVATYQNCIRLRPEYPEAHHNLGNALWKLGRMSEAALAYQEAVRLRPQYSKAWYRLASVFGELGSADDVIGSFRRVINLHPRLPTPRGALLYTIHYAPQYDAEAIFHEHREWGRLFCDPLIPHLRPHENSRDPERRLRVGYVSPDLREHTVTKFITAAMEHHDRENFEVFCYSDAEKPDAVTERLRRAVEHWHDTRGVKDAALDQMIRRDQIDTLVDLRGHAADNRLTLFARKPAPVQVNMVGYFNTTGLATMDYRITDEHQDPPGMTEQFHTEQLVRLPHSCWCYTADEDVPDVSEPPALRNGYVTFGSLNKIVKVSEPCAKLWARVLDRVAGSRLVLSVAETAPTLPARGQSPNPLASPGVPGEGEVKEGVPQESQPRADAPQNCPVRDRLSQLGLPVDRIDLLGKTATRRQYLERFNQIDIALDTIPFNGITTTCDGLWQGVPCVSLAGRTSVSRAGRSILRAANLPELATDTPDAFVRAAIELATDLERLRELRMSMRNRLLASPLLDHRGFAHHLESAYRRMWRAWCVGGVT